MSGLPTHCQICLCPTPHHAVNCPVFLGASQGGALHFHPSGQYYQQDYEQPQMGGGGLGSGGGLADHMRIERLEKELAALAARVAKLERGR
jgi:hypothetical protein